MTAGTLWSLIALVPACGLRTQMDGCSEGSEGCPCLAGTCDPGLVCDSNVCVEPLVGSGGRPATGGMPSGGHPGGGGIVATGGLGGRGGAQSGGIAGSGARIGSGGTAGYGGLASGGAGGRGTGGKAGAGGTAGASSVAGRPGSGGTAGFGGAGGRSGRGGAAGYAGATGGTGGASSVGGKSGTGATLYVTFSNGRASGPMEGWGWVAMGSKASLTSPTCGGQPLTSPGDCSSYEWSSTTSLCMTGNVPPNSGGADYSENWGVMVAAESTSPSGGGLGSSYPAVAFEVSGSPSTGLRGVVHRKGDSDGTVYCTYITPGTAVSFTSFNSACWDGSGKPLTMEDVPTLDWVGVMVPAVSTAVKISNLCLTRIRFEW